MAHRAQCEPRCDGGAQDSKKTRNKGDRKCRKRGVHIKTIQNGFKQKHETKRLIMTGIWPALANRHAGMGVCPSSLSHIRAMAAESCGKKTKTACTTTILHVHLGETGDPATWFPVDQVRTWLELQREDLEHKLSKVPQAWAAAAGKRGKSLDGS